MPIVDEHVRFCVKRFGKEYEELCYMVNSWMDAPSVDMGPSHRRSRHDYVSTPLEAMELYGDQMAADMVLQHLTLDGLVTPDQERAWSPELAEEAQERRKIEQARADRIEKQLEQLDHMSKELEVEEQRKQEEAERERQKKIEHEKTMAIERDKREAKRESRRWVGFAVAAFSAGAILVWYLLKPASSFDFLLVFLGGCAVAIAAVLMYAIVFDSSTNVKIVTASVIGCSLFGYFYNANDPIGAAIIFGFVGIFIGIMLVVILSLVREVL